jgi:hypothetical protein
MLGLVITLVAATSPALPAAAACGEGPESCDLAPLAAVERSEPREYATPAVIDCRSPAVPSAIFLEIVGECIGPHDASYRVSRDPEGENSPSLSPASRDRRGVASCDGLPQRAPALPLSDAQPAALFAAPVVVHVAVAVREPPADWKLPSRFGDPPERPPRV